MSVHDRSLELSYRTAAAILGGLALAGLMAVLALAPPTARSTDAPADRFSAGRAMALVERLAEAPHATGTEAHRAVRETITAELATLGLEPQVQETTSVVQRGRTLVAARVANILARLPGELGSPAILLMAHYDTQPSAPGAGDDTAGVATILETVRALRAGPPLQHDVIALITDAEEWGLLGARAFVEQHPWAAEVGLVLNFEGRGHGGVSTMFETTPGAAPLVRALRSTSAPVATSLSGEIYRRMPNDTDFSVFRDAGVPGLNFAFIGGLTSYHTALDTPRLLDPRSLQHHGSYALALTRRFGETGIPASGGESIYFNPFGRAMVTYPAPWATPLALAALFAAVAAVVLARRRGLPTTGLGRAMGWMALALVAAPAAAAATWWLLRRLAPGLVAGPYGMPYDADRTALALLAIVVLAWAFVASRGRVAATTWMAAVALAWSLLAVVTAVAVPGASYLFVWPALAAAVGLGALASGVPAGPVSSALAAGFGALAGVVLWLPILRQVVDALTFRATPVLAFLAALTLSLAAPLLAAVGRRRVFAAVCLAVCVASAGVAVLRSGGPDHPSVNSLVYVLDADTVEARWLSFDRRLDPWTRRRLGDEASRGPRPEIFGNGPTLWQRPAVVAPLPRPRVETVLDLVDGATGEGRSLSLFLISPRRAPVLRLVVESEAAVRGVWLDGTRHDFGEGGGPISLRLLGMPPEGLALTLELAEAQPVDLVVTDQSFGLPVPPGEQPDPRPEGSIPRPGWWTDGAFVTVRETL